MKIQIRAATILVITAALGLSACGKKEESVREVIEDNIITEVPVEDAAPMNSVDAAPPPVAPTNAANAAPPPAFTDTEQMRDDADATGLTSRLPRDEVPGAAANEAQPAQ